MSEAEQQMAWSNTYAGFVVFSFRGFAVLWLGFGALALVGLSPMSQAETPEDEVEAATLALAIGFALLMVRLRLFGKPQSHTDNGADRRSLVANMSLFCMISAVVTGAAVIRWGLHREIDPCVVVLCGVVLAGLLSGGIGLALRKAWGWWIAWGALFLVGATADLFLLDMAGHYLTPVSGAARIGVGLGLGGLNMARTACTVGRLGPERWFSPFFTLVGLLMLGAQEGGLAISGILLFFLFFIREFSLPVRGVLEPFTGKGVH